MLKTRKVALTYNAQEINAVLHCLKTNNLHPEIEAIQVEKLEDDMDTGETFFNVVYVLKHEHYFNYILQIIHSITFKAGAASVRFIYN